VHLLQYMACVMQSDESLDGLKYLDTSSHIFWTLDDGWMGFILTCMVTMACRWTGSPHLGQCTPHLIHHLMEDVALGYAWTLLREVVHDHSTLDDFLLTPNVGLLDDDVMH
jgi:hypothetical protein